MQEFVETSRDPAENNEFQKGTRPTRNFFFFFEKSYTVETCEGSYYMLLSTKLHMLIECILYAYTWCSRRSISHGTGFDFGYDEEKADHKYFVR